MTHPTTELYFEAHITVDPVFGNDLEAFKEISARYQFRVADLLMQKRQEDTPERSKFDTFCTGRGTDYMDIKTRMCRLVFDLQTRCIKVRRYKLENTLIDERLK